MQQRRLKTAAEARELEYSLLVLLYCLPYNSLFLNNLTKHVNGGRCYPSQLRSSRPTRERVDIITPFHTHYSEAACTLRHPTRTCATFVRGGEAEHEPKKELLL